nr:hypothetical protein OG999_26165 [Streptomyces sp. NBC_00886]
MTPWLHTPPSLHVTGLLLLVLGTGGVVGPYGDVLAYGAEPGRSSGGPAVTATASASALGHGSGSDAGRLPAPPPVRHPAHAPGPGETLAPASASADPSRAGSRAGEGRERPGRTAEPTTDEDGDESGGEGDGEDTPGLEADDGDRSDSPAPADSASRQEAGLVPSSPPLQPVHQTVARAEDPAEPVLRILPLGSGLILIGLGLGLAFIALRVRRN